MEPLESRSKAPSPRASAGGALQSRRDFLSSALAAPALITALPQVIDAAGEVITFKSPNGQVEFILFAAGPELRYRVRRVTQIAVETSAVVMLVDGVNLCQSASITKIERFHVHEKYLTRGWHATASNDANGARIFCRHDLTRTEFNFETRVYNDGVAFRFIVPGDGTRVPDEGSSFTL